MDFGLTDRRALVLGGARGIGRGIAGALAAEGVALTIAGRDTAALETAAAEIGAATGRTPATQDVDLGKPESVDALIASVGDLDVLVLNGGGPPAGSALSFAPEVWRAQFEAMVLSPIRIAEAVLPGMRARGFGRLLMVLSSGVVQPLPNLGLSNSLRLALVGWAKTVAAEVAADGVTVNGIAPGRIQTSRVDSLDAGAAAKQGKDIEAIRAASRATIPAGRYGTPEEFGSVAAFLASQQASYVTGSVLRVDGGLIRSL